MEDKTVSKTARDEMPNVDVVSEEAPTDIDEAA